MFDKDTIFFGQNTYLRNINFFLLILYQAYVLFLLFFFSKLLHKNRKLFFEDKRLHERVEIINNFRNVFHCDADRSEKFSPFNF